ncbi:MAG: hypothetical protein U0X39_09535 [Bacteroidales bacterium]
MAILASKDLAHGPIEALFTIDEETGMTGVFGLEPGMLKGDILMNLDSEDEGELYVGCAGGIDISATKKYAEEATPGGVKAYKVTIKGLKRVAIQELISLLAGLTRTSCSRDS